MAISIHGQEYMAPSTRILVFPDHYVAVPHTFKVGDPAATTIEGRQVIPQGTVYPANDGTALGVLMHDVDITQDDVTSALIIHGFLKKANMPEELSTAAKAVLPMIAELPLNADPNP